MTRSDACAIVEKVAFSEGIRLPEVRFERLHTVRACCGVSPNGKHFISFDSDTVRLAWPAQVEHLTLHEVIHLRKRHPEIRVFCYLLTAAFFASFLIYMNWYFLLAAVLFFALVRAAIIPLQEHKVSAETKKRLFDVKNYPRP